MNEADTWLDAVVKAAPVKPYYRDSAVVIFNADCKKIVPTLPRADLLLTDPPYGGGYASHPVCGKGKKSSNHASMNWDDSAPEIGEFIRACNGAIVWGGNYQLLPPSRRWLAWIKRDAPPSLSNIELAWTSFDANAKFFDWTISATNAERVGHPTQKPLALMLWCIGLTGDVQTILDPFAGSCTTGRAAKDLGRLCVCIDREERYCEIGAKRMQQEVLPIFTPTAAPDQEHGLRLL